MSVRPLASTVGGLGGLAGLSSSLLQMVGLPFPFVGLEGHLSVPTCVRWSAGLSWELPLPVFCDALGDVSLSGLCVKVMSGYERIVSTKRGCIVK